MKKIIIIFLIATLGIPTYGQPGKSEGEIQTLFGSDWHSLGGYVGFGAGYSMIDDKDGIVMTGRAAFLTGHNLGIGIAGAGFINDFHYNPALDANVNLTGGYGGILIEPILFPRSPVHLAFPVIAGIGGIAYTTSNFTGEPWDYYEAWVEDTETFLIIEPGVELEFNLLKFFRLALGMSYRYTSNIDLMDTPSNVLEGFTTGISFKFGKF